MRSSNVKKYFDMRVLVLVFWSHTIWRATALKTGTKMRISSSCLTGLHSTDESAHVEIGYFS